MLHANFATRHFGVVENVFGVRIRVSVYAYGQLAYEIYAAHGRIR
jgi:hypothetical protein